MKVFLIIFGALFGVFVLCVIALAILVPIVGKKLVGTMSDPVAQRAAAAKVARFKLPPGYRIVAATDFGISQSIVIAREGRAGSRMVIQLTAQHVPSDPKTQVDTLVTSLSLTAKLRGCDLKEAPDETIDRPGTSPAVLRVLNCEGKPGYEVGVIAAQASMVSLTATNVTPGAAHDALTALVASIR